MKTRPFYTDQSFWLLLVINLSLIVYYLYYNTGFKTLVWVYWCQSVIIGIFTFLNLLLPVTPVPAAGKETAAQESGGGCFAFFFAGHYGLFHLVYMIFLFGMGNPGERLDWTLFEVSVTALFLDQLWSFIRSRLSGQNAPIPGVIFILPYLRVVPMHLTILLPKFLNIPALGIFLVLKMVADLLMYLITRKLYGYNNMPESPETVWFGRKTNGF